MSEEITASKSEIEELLTILKDIQQNEQKEMKYAKKQSRFAMFMSALGLVLVVGFLVYAFPLIGRVNQLMDNVNNVIEDTAEITNDLAEMDMKGLFEEVDGLVVQSQGTIEEAMDKISSLDIETLNDSINGLQSVIDPLAKMFGGRR